MSDCACCNHVVNELLRAQHRIEVLEKKLASAEGWVKHFRERYGESGDENERLARRIRSFEGAATRRRNQAKSTKAKERE